MDKKTSNDPPRFLLTIGKIGDIMENVLLVIGSAFIVIFFLAVVLDVVARTANNSFFWTQDTAIFSYFWCVFVAGAICVRRNEHFSIELFSKLPKTAAVIKKLLVMAVMFLFTFYITRYGWEYAMYGLTRKSSSSGLRLFYAIICLPISGVGFAYFLFEQLLLLITGRDLSEISKKHCKLAEMSKEQGGN